MRQDITYAATFRILSQLETNSFSHRVQIDNVPPGSVVFVHAPEGTTNAVYGGMMSRRARVRQAVGTVVCGRVRDLEEHKALGFPVSIGIPRVT